MPGTFADSLQTDAPLADLGPLAWVFDELRKSLAAANKAIQRFVREAEQSRNHEPEALDPAALRLARQQLHQAVGALEMVGLGAAARVLHAMEAAVQRFVQHPRVCTEEAAAKIERASFALIEYLEAVLSNKPVQPVALFSQYREVQELAAAGRIHPADLWPLEHRHVNVQVPAQVTALRCDAPLRSLFDRLVLLVLKTQSPAAALQLAKLSAGLSAGASAQRVQTFWRVAAAYFEALAQQLLPNDAYVKRAASRILLQFVAFARGPSQVSETLLHDLLFFCAQASAASADKTPHLVAVRTAFGLDALPAVDYQQATLGRFDPALLTQARKRIVGAKEAWSLFCGGDGSRARAVGEQFSLVADSLLKLHPASTVLAQALVQAAEQAGRTPAGPPAELALEVATTTLYLESAFEDFDPSDSGMTERTQALAQRLQQVLTGAPAQALDPWMEQLYRRVSDRQTMGSVVGELKVSLGVAEKSLDQFFRKPHEKGGLHAAVSQLAQMRGVLSVLGLEQAVQTVARMRATVDQILDTEVDEAMAREAGTFQKLGHNLSALSLLVDMLSYQPALARKLFVFDEGKGELLPLMGRSPSPEQPGAEQDGAALRTDVQRVVEAVHEDLNPSELSQQLDSLASLAEQTGVARTARAAAQAVVGDAPAAARSLTDLAHATPSADLATPDTRSSEDREEDELLEIFLEEARDVVGHGLEALRLLQVQPANLEHLTTLRRSFHTLKGSSRMVGLEEFGSAAWALEQLINTVLAEQRAAPPQVLRLSREALGALAHWAQDVAAHNDGRWRAQPFRASVEAWQMQAQYLPLNLWPAVPEPDTTASAESRAAATDFDQSDEAAAAPTAGLEVTADFVDTVLFMDEPEPAPAPLSDGVAGQAPDERVFEDIDFDRLGPPSSSTEQTAAAPIDPAPGPQATALRAMLEGITLDLVPPPVPDADPTATPPALQADAAPPVTGQVDETPALEGVLEEAVAGVMAQPPFEDMADEQVRVIGDLRIGIKLYNVYLNEADEGSRRLCTELAEWALERHQPVPEAAAAWAHSLAGSSAAVGFDSLCGIARALEQALETVARHQRSGHAASAEQAQWFVDTAGDMRRLLHQFAAGFLKEPKPELLAALERMLHEPVPETVLEPESEAQAQPDAEPVAALDASASSDPFAARSGAVDPVQDIDDDIDVSDSIDVDLFPIFAEEAQELLPQLGAALRQWVARPDNGSARAEVLRNLHTLKGSARLAGALRLGEMVHRMEADAERLGAELHRSADLEPLQSAFDAIVMRLELLRRPDSQTVGVLQRAPEQAALVRPATGVAALPATATATQDAAVPAAGAPGLATPKVPIPIQLRVGAAVRVRAERLDRLVNQVGEVMTTRARMESELLALRGSLKDLTGNLGRLRQQLRDIELQAETQLQSRLAQARDADQSFDPLEFDRFTRVQELTRMMAESVNDVATVQRNLQRAVEATEDGLVAQARQTREMQRELLRTRMVEFEGISERLYRVVRQASKETGKQVRLDISGGHIEIDRSVLDRMTAAFEHLLRNSVVHGIEAPAVRLAAGKPAEGRIDIHLAQERNDVSLVFQDDGAGIDLPRLREKAEAQGYVLPGAQLSDEAAAELVFAAGLSTVREVSELAGRGIGMDVVRSDVVALGGRIEIQTQAAQGARFKLVLPLTTAITHVVLVRAGALTLGVPSNLVELVRRVSSTELAQAYASGTLAAGAETLPFYWAGALLQSSAHSLQAQSQRTLPVIIFRSADQRLAMHFDEVLGNQEVVVKNLGPQLARLPGLAGISVLASGAVVLIYNPVALAAVYGAKVPGWVAEQQQAGQDGFAAPLPTATTLSTAPLVLVVDDSITVRRVTQRLLQREGYRVALATDGLQAIEQLQQERPAVVLTDIEMPRMDGFDLVRNIRSDARLSDLPVIMITSRMAAKHREHARALGVDHYLGKPYAEDELLALVARCAQIAAAA